MQHYTSTENIDYVHKYLGGSDLHPLLNYWVSALHPDSSIPHVQKHIRTNLNTIPQPSTPFQELWAVLYV